MDTQKDVAAIRGLIEVVINDLLKTGGKFNYEQIGKEYSWRHRELIEKDSRFFLDINSLHKAMSDVNKALKKHDLALIMEGSNKRGFLYSYPEGAGEIIDQWLDKKSRDKKRMRLTEVLKLFAMSKGLLPESWVADLTPKIKELEDAEGSKSKIIEFDFNDQLTNLYNVPTFIEAIEGRKVLSLVNNARYMYDVPIIFTPYYIKEYNHRFFCVGLCRKVDGTIVKDYIVAIDRVSDIRECTDEPYQHPQKDYSTFFDDIVGVRHETDRETGQWMEKLHIEIETRNQYTHGRIVSKKIHPSQREEKKFGEAENGMGRVSIDVIPNLELTSVLLGFGSNIRVLEPKFVAERIAKNARAMSALYDESTP